MLSSLIDFLIESFTVIFFLAINNSQYGCTPVTAGGLNAVLRITKEHKNGMALHEHESKRIIRQMRINLVTPFAEKDAVKALGARWDAAKKLWYIVDVADLTPFMRWIPNMEMAAENAVSASQQETKPASARSQKSTAPPPSNSLSAVPHCGCSVLPWDDCVHTIKPQ